MYDRDAKDKESISDEERERAHRISKKISEGLKKNVKSGDYK
jgi:hypothetical protein